MPRWGEGGEFMSSGRRGGSALVGGRSAPMGRGAAWRGEWVHMSSGPPGAIAPGHGGGVSLPLGHYTSATGASARPTLAALLRRRGLGVAVMLGVVAALGVVAVLPPSPGQPCCRRMSAHSWLPAWRA